MFELFTDRARRVVVLAQDECRGLHHDKVGSEHLLLGLLVEGEGLAAETLRSLGISLGASRGAVEEMVPQVTSPPPEHIPFTQEAKRVLERSLVEAARLRHRHIGTEHLLLGITDKECMASGVFQRLGVEPSRIWGGVRRRIDASARPSSGSSPT